MIQNATKAVAAAATAEPLAAVRTMCCWLQIQGKSANAGSVFVGGSAVSAANGLEILPGETLPILPMAEQNVHDLRDVYIDAANNGDGVNVLYGVRV